MARERVKYCKTENLVRLLEVEDDFGGFTFNFYCCI